jgi:hypothetical protein
MGSAPECILGMIAAAQLPTVAVPTKTKTETKRNLASDPTIPLRGYFIFVIVKCLS